MDEVNRLADGRARGDHVIYDYDVSLKGGADELASLSVVLYFFAVEGKGHIPLMMIGEGRGSRRGQWNAFVGRTKKHERFWFKFGKGCGIKSRQPREFRAAVE